MHGSKIKILILFGLGLSVLIIITKPAIFNPTRIASLNTTAPALNAARRTSSFIKRLIPFASYRDEIKRLHSKIDAYSQEILRLKAIEADNSRLKGLLYFKKQVPFWTVPAQVIGRDPSNWSNSVIIDKGRDQSIRPNMAVVSPRGIVGRVVEAGRNSAKVLLITDPNSKVGAILEKNREGGIVVGRPGGACKMIYISLDSDMAIGDKVFTAGYGAIFPKGILIGEVAGCGKEPGRLYKYAIIRPSQDFSKLEEVLCIK